MSAFMILNFDISDPAGYAQYVGQVGPMLIAREADMLVVSNDAELLEGSKNDMTVVIKFESDERIRSFYDSLEYAPLKALRLQSTTHHSCIIAQGFVSPAA